jgi:hypothetical protein
MATTTVQMAITGPSYVSAPDAERARDLRQAGACAVCDVRAKGCWCRWCPACSRFWLAYRSARRNPDLDADHHGVKAETCAPCAASALDPQLQALVAQVTMATDRHNVLLGKPHVLSAICARLGFRNDCRNGRVYLTDTKLQSLGLVDGYRSPS